MSDKLILVLNCGSSSLKFAVINSNNGKKHIYGVAECFGLSEARIKWKIYDKKLLNQPIEKEISLNDKYTHRDVLTFIINNILNQDNLLFQLSAIGHRVVHGGQLFTKPVIINNDVLKNIKDSIPFAPLHNPNNLIGIYEALKGFPSLSKRNVAVFDTSFHQTMPEESYLYALPYSLYQKHAIRRYGAHGISHFYVSRETAKLLNKTIAELNIITCHLGNGSSISAIRNGKCIDTSMGLTPLEGLVMGTRCGDIDPAIILYLHDSLHLSLYEVKKLLIEKSGLLGLTGITNDFRYVENNYYNKDDARRAMNIYCHRLVKYIGAYSVLMEGKLDALVFTGGIGENAALMRDLSLKKLSILNFKIDYAKNLATRYGRTGIITSNDSRPAFVIPTNEELVIAQNTSYLIS